MVFKNKQLNPQKVAVNCYQPTQFINYFCLSLAQEIFIYFLHYATIYHSPQPVSSNHL